MNIRDGMAASMVGSFLGMICLYFPYSPDEATQINGIPLAFVVNKKEGDHWVDYIASGWVLLIDFGVGCATGLLAIFIWFYLIRFLARRAEAERPLG